MRGLICAAFVVVDAAIWCVAGYQIGRRHGERTPHYSEGR